MGLAAAGDLSLEHYPAISAPAEPEPSSDPTVDADDALTPSCRKCVAQLPGRFS